MTENEITGDILDASINLHRQFGAGLLESVYETPLSAPQRLCAKIILSNLSKIRMEKAK